MVLCKKYLGGTIEVPAEELQFRPSAYAIIRHEENLLLLKNVHTGMWNLPGGGIDLGETIEQGLRRELREECNIEIEIQRQAFFDSSFFYFDPSDQAFQTILLYFECKACSLDVTDQFNSPSDVSRDPSWVSIETLSAKDFQINGDQIMEFLKSN